MHLKGSRVAAYARYSSDRQSETSVEDQLRRLRTFASANGRALKDTLTFTDHAISGASTARPGFEALMDRVKRREIDVLLVEDTSRLSRDNADALNLYKQLSFFGVQLVAISDGIDSSTKGAKLAYSVKALMSDMYLEDLRDKTLRGLEGRALAGFATGGRLLGYRTSPIMGPDGRTPTSFKIEIDPEGAALVRRIFAEYLAGRSFMGIATILNQEGIPSPRDKTQHGKKPGWPAGTVRAILYNERYTGVRTFNERRWTKVPGTNKRRPERKDPSEVIRSVQSELRIVDQVTWEAVQERLSDIKARFTKTADGRPKGRAHGRGSLYPFSGLLVCGKCGGNMTVRGGNADRRYYFCTAAGRGRCDVKQGVLTRVVADCLFSAIHDELASPERLDHARKKLAELLGEKERTRTAQMKEHRARLDRVQARVKNLIEVLSAGENSQAIREALRDMETHAATERQALAELEAQGEAPIRLPSPDELLSKLAELRENLEEDPLEGREALRRFIDGEIRLDLGEDGIFTARTSVLPLVLLGAKTPNGIPGNQGSRLNDRSSGGRI